jgi:superfamily II DNA/RNA helicase
VQVILAGFRAGRFQVLVATNVAARGLDISDVQLIIQVCYSFIIDAEAIMSLINMNILL